MRIRYYCQRSLLIIGNLFLFFIYSGSFAQSIPLGTADMDEALRRLQLQGKFDEHYSFASRSFRIAGRVTSDSIYRLIDSASPIHSCSYAIGKYGVFKILPFNFISQFNSHHPYGWNDGAMIGAKGYQTLIRAGFYAAIGPLEVQVTPEIVYAANSRYENNSDYGNVTKGSYQKLLPGQSSISLSSGAFSVGLSTENLWWGPGRRSSLLMSNNAPGSLHAFFRSKRPAITPLGSFEWQLIGSKLTVDNNLAYENFNLKQSLTPEKNRYQSAFVISWQPKWVPSVFLGMTRSLQRYKADLQLSGASFFNKYIPVISKPFQKKNAVDDDTLRTDQLATFFLRWVFPASHAEFYIEYGLNDYGIHVRDYVMAPTHSGAYTMGAKKIFPLKHGEYLDMSFELTQMSQTPDYMVREAGNWYIHGAIQEGYTHENQIIGAGAGLGCNVQSITGTWVRGWKQLGVLLERVERDPQYHSLRWIDLSIGLMPQLKYRNIIFSGIFQFINSSQYAWEKNANRFNLHSMLRVSYLL